MIHPSTITQGFKEDNDSLKVSDEHREMFDKLEDFLGAYRRTKTLL
jgi:hypothetical protein